MSDENNYYSRGSESSESDQDKISQLTPEVIEAWVKNKEYTHEELRQLLLGVNDNLDSYSDNGQLDPAQLPHIDQVIQNGLKWLYQDEILMINQRSLDNPDRLLKDILEDLWRVVTQLNQDTIRDNSPINEDIAVELHNLIEQSVKDYFEAYRDKLSQGDLQDLLRTAKSQGMVAVDDFAYLNNLVSKH